MYPLTKSEAERIINEQYENDKEEDVPSNPEKRPINDIRNEFKDKNKEQKQNDESKENNN